MLLIFIASCKSLAAYPSTPASCEAEPSCEERWRELSRGERKQGAWNYR